MSSKERANACWSFQNDPDKTIFLLSLHVASLGLNLTAASYVILLDPWYNPSVESQAIGEISKFLSSIPSYCLIIGLVDRCVRFGQTKHVKVLRLYITDSIEERMRSIQEKKMRITQQVLEDPIEQGIQERRASISNVRMWRELFR